MYKLSFGVDADSVP